ncbi:MAG: DUF2178 domain-containing protein [Clostridia bacterium]|nr:DUF2178 domain-containing protein [Clostridia bacterium]
MKFKNKIKTRMYLAITYFVIGLILTVAGNLIGSENQYFSSFGAVFAVMGAAKFLQNFMLLKDDKKLQNREIEETDERNVQIWTKARSLAFIVYITLAAIAVVVLSLTNHSNESTVISYCLFSFIFIYWICYFIIRKKY